MSQPSVMPRRAFLRGLGTGIALPLLASMMPPTRALAAGARALPRRLVFIYVPNGAHMADWTPKTVGRDFELTPSLEPLRTVRDQIQVLTGLAHQKAFANGDGAGDHARASATFLTGCQARKTGGADVRIGISADQVAALKIGRETRFPSLELGIDRGQRAGACDSGYACAYQYNISWRSESVPNPPEINPAALFDRLFGAGTRAEQAENRGRRDALRKSILDFAIEDTRRLQDRLGAEDKAKLDEYLTSVRELEQRIVDAPKHAESLPGKTRPDGVPPNYEQHVRLMFDLLALALQTDNTRIATFIMAHDGSNRPYPGIGVPEGHHDLSHHAGNREKQAKIARINRFHVTQFAAFLERLRSIREGEGTLLDQSMIVYGSGISDGNRHNHDDLPVLLAGGGGGSLQPGRHVRFAREPMTNLYLTLLDHMGVTADRLGDSTGRLKGV